jgi:hypothetical protein
MKITVDISFEELLRIVQNLPAEQLAQVKKVLEDTTETQEKASSENI